MHLAVVVIVVVHQSAPAASLLDVLAQLATIAGFFVIVIAAMLAWLAWRHPVPAQACPRRTNRSSPPAPSQQIRSDGQGRQAALRWPQPLATLEAEAADLDGAKRDPPAARDTHPARRRR